MDIGCWILDGGWNPASPASCGTSPAFRRQEYGGPSPPSGTHRYYFKLYALDTILDLGPGATKKQVEAAMQEHILAQAQLMGRYARRR